MLPLIGITKVGAQVMSLGKFQANTEYIVALGQLILEKGFEVFLGDVQETQDNRYYIVNALPVVRPSVAAAGQ